jgi:hypothetical protein
MRLIEYGALVMVGWIAFDVLFVIAWARLHSARRRFEDQITGTVIVARRDGGVRPELAYFDGPERDDRGGTNGTLPLLKASCRVSNVPSVWRLMRWRLIR